MIDLLIADTNILIDLNNSNLLSLINKLPYNIGFSDALFTELDDPSYDSVTEAGFVEYSLKPEAVDYVFELNEKYSKPSIPDLFSLVVAKENNAILLTGDKNLRKASNDIGIIFKGILWLLDEMVEHSVINRYKASESLTTILDQGAFLPKKECDDRLRKWKSS